MKKISNFFKKTPLAVALFFALAAFSHPASATDVLVINGQVVHDGNLHTAGPMVLAGGDGPMGSAPSNGLSLMGDQRDVPITIDLSCFPISMERSLLLNQLISAIELWNGANSKTKLHYVGDVAGGLPYANHVQFVSGTCPYAGTGCAAEMNATAEFIDGKNVIKRFVIKIYSRYEFGTAVPWALEPVSFFGISISFALAHELGHALGFAHFTTGGEVLMSGFFTTGENTPSLSDADILGARELQGTYTGPDIYSPSGSTAELGGVTEINLDFPDSQAGKLFFVATGIGAAPQMIPSQFHPSLRFIPYMAVFGGTDWRNIAIDPAGFLSLGSSAILPDGVGILDANGNATIHLVLPNEPSFAGIPLHFVAILVEEMQIISRPLELTLAVGGNP